MGHPDTYTNVARDPGGEDVEHCNHLHTTANEANDCVWCPQTKGCDIYIETNYDLTASSPCVHLLHPAECLRCLRLRCIHLLDPDECPRCIDLNNDQT